LIPYRYLLRPQSQSQAHQSDGRFAEIAEIGVACDGRASEKWSLPAVERWLDLRQRLGIVHPGAYSPHATPDGNSRAKTDLLFLQNSEENFKNQ
jgi:hypothetical protein